MKLIFSICILMFISTNFFLPGSKLVFSSNSNKTINNQKIEKQERHITKLLRCVVCQNQSIYESNADIANDMRLLVRERILAGDSKDQVLDYIVARYGDYILLKPPLQGNTILLWMGPPLMALVLAIVIILLLKTYQHENSYHETEELITPEDREFLDNLGAELKPEVVRKALKKKYISNPDDNKYVFNKDGNDQS
jgi:cytochrome c-type biogenesis protein CcmH